MSESRGKIAATGHETCGARKNHPIVKSARSIRIGASRARKSQRQIHLYLYSGCQPAAVSQRCASTDLRDNNSWQFKIDD
jgi:hypothetical protein